MYERVLRLSESTWPMSTYGQCYDLILLNRMPENEYERVWVTEVLPTRLAPGGRILDPEGRPLEGVPQCPPRAT